jgi:hypothetical protein
MILIYGTGMLVLGLGVGFGACVYLQRQTRKILQLQQRMLDDIMNRVMTKTWAEYTAVAAVQSGQGDEVEEYGGMSDAEEARIEQERNRSSAG